MGVRCVLCQAEKKEGLSFHKFPKNDSEKCLQWIKQCGLEDMLKRKFDGSVHFEAFYRYSLCEKHFTGDSYKAPSSTRARLLKPEAKPTLHLTRVKLTRFFSKQSMVEYEDQKETKVKKEGKLARDNVTLIQSTTNFVEDEPVERMEIDSDKNNESLGQQEPYIVEPQPSQGGKQVCLLPEDTETDQVSPSSKIPPLLLTLNISISSCKPFIKFSDGNIETEAVQKNLNSSIVDSSYSNVQELGQCCTTTFKNIDTYTSSKYIHAYQDTIIPYEIKKISEKLSEGIEMLQSFKNDMANKLPQSDFIVFEEYMAGIKSEDFRLNCELPIQKDKLKSEVEDFENTLKRATPEMLLISGVQYDHTLDENVEVTVTNKLGQAIRMLKSFETDIREIKNLPEESLNFINEYINGIKNEGAELLKYLKLMPPTIQVPELYDAEADCEALKKAMKGFGTDEDTIVNILAHRSNAQRQVIAEKYKTMYGKDLTEKLVSEISGNFKDLVVAAMTPTVDFLAQELHDAMDGLGTDESVLIEIICSFTNEWIRLVKEKYEQMFGNTLESDIEGDTSGPFKKLLVSLCQGARDESPDVDMDQVKTDVQALIDAGISQVGTDESVFNSVMATRSYNHLRVLFEMYEEMAGTPFDETIKSEFSGDAKDAFIAVVQVMQNSYLFYAKQLHKALSGIGTKDKTLIRIVVVGCEAIHLDGAKKYYLEKYGKSLAEDVASDTSGDYQKMLLALIN